MRAEHIEGGLTALVLVHIGGLVAALVFGRTDAVPLFAGGLVFAGGALAAFYRVRGQL